MCRYVLMLQILRVRVIICLLNFWAVWKYLKYIFKISRLYRIYGTSENGKYCKAR